MTDDETLLRKAAMAAGYKPVRMTMGSEWPRGLLLEGVQQPWNSLDSSGDALDLAVALGVVLDKHYTAPENDAISATRRAITRAAAAIYDSQQEQA